MPGSSSSNDRKNSKLPNFIKKPLKPIAGLVLHPRVGTKPEPRSFGPVEVAPFKYDCGAALCLSADFELAWAWMYDEPAMSKMGAAGRKNMPQVLKALNDRNIPITWAIVGHLFLDSCKRDKNTGLAHGDMPRPKKHYSNPHWTFEAGDWYQHDPCSNLDKEPAWYALDLIRDIIESKPNHEIGTHTFSHIDFSNENCDSELAVAEINKCIEVMAKFDLKPRSMVFPGGFEGNFKALLDAGIQSYRGFSKIDISYPVKTKDKLWNITQSLFLFAHPGENYLNKSLRYIKKAIEINTVCHLSFHPSNLEKSQLEGTFIPVLDFAVKKREEGRLWIATMTELASYCEARDRIDITTDTKSDGYEINIKHDLDTNRYCIPEITLKVKIPDGQSIESVKVNNINFELDTKKCFVKKDTDNFLVFTVPLDCKKIVVNFVKQ